MCVLPSTPSMSAMSASSLSGFQEHWQHSSTMADSYPNALTLMSALPQPRQEPKPTSLTSPTNVTATSKPSGLRRYLTMLTGELTALLFDQNPKAGKSRSPSLLMRRPLQSFSSAPLTTLWIADALHVEASMKTAFMFYGALAPSAQKPALRLFMTFKTTSPDTIHPSQWRIC